MFRWIMMALLALGLAVDAVSPACASITTTKQKSSMKSLAGAFIQPADGLQSSEDPAILEKHAQAGDVHARMMLGKDYLFGLGVPRDEARGLHWLQMAVDQDDHDAMALLGAYLVFIRGKPASVERGLVYLKKLADRGQPHDMGVYGIAMFSSAGSPASWATGFSYIRKAAHQRDPEAALMLGLAYTSGHGTFWNPFKAVHWYTKALEYPLPAEMARVAQFELGAAYMNGQGVEKDEARGAALIRKAAEAGSPEAAYTLALMFRHGTGVTRDASKAQQWMLTAAQAGSPGAQFAMGMDLALGHKRYHQYKQAIPWLERAAKSGYGQAYSLLGLMHQMGWGFPSDNHAAARSWMQGARLGDGLSAAMLAHDWANEFSTEGNIYGVMWLTIAGQLGYENADRELHALEQRMKQPDIDRARAMAVIWLKQRASGQAAPASASTSTRTADSTSN